MFPPDMVAFLELGEMARWSAQRAIEAAQKVDEAFGARTSYALDEVRLLAPLARPRVIRDFLTFEGHMKQASRALGRGDQIPQAWYEVPAYYKGDSDTVIGTGENVNMPPYCENFDLELELGMVIGRSGKRSRRTTRKNTLPATPSGTISAPRPAEARGPLGMGPSKGKDFDTGNAVGPYLVTSDEMDLPTPA